MTLSEDLKEIWKGTSREIRGVWNEYNKYRTHKFKDCIDPILCRQCRRFVEQILTKEAFRQFPGSRWKFGEFDITINHRGVLRGPDYAKSDLRDHKCPLCRLLINAWRQVLSEKHTSTFLNLLQIQIPLEPDAEFAVCTDAEDNRGQVDFVFCSDGPGTRWLEEWFSEKESPDNEQGKESDPETLHTTVEAGCEGQKPGDFPLDASTSSESESESSESSYSDVDPVLLPSQAPEVIAQIRSWLKECIADHEVCSRKVSGLPSRVIDVGKDGDSFKPILYITHGEREPYVTLSYRWGVIPSTVLTGKNIGQFQKAIPKSAMPSTIRDAIVLTRKLGIRYLWVDALCIQQGDPLDWEIESNKMSKIYDGSHLTIAADEANSRHAGLFQERSVRITKKPLPAGHHIYVQRARWGIEATHDTILAARAWTLQEQINSTAVIHFSSRSLLWECRTRCMDEHDEEFPTHPILKNFHGTNYDAKDVGSSKMLWYHLVANYSKRTLTVEGDRLSALAGLAEKCQSEQWHMGRYLAGLWEGDLPAALLWTGGFRWGLEDESPSKGPSWSWASSLLPDGISWPKSFLRGEAQIQQEDDCILDGHGIYLSTDSKAATSVHGRLAISALLQPVTARFLAQLASPDLDNAEELDPPLPEALGDQKYWEEREVQWSRRGDEWTKTEDFESMVVARLRNFRSWRTTEPFWFSTALDRFWETFAKPLYVIKICSWPCPKDVTNVEDTSEYTETHFLLLEPIKPKSVGAEDEDNSIDATVMEDGPETITHEITSDETAGTPRLCFRRAGTCAYTHKKDNRNILGKAVRRDIMLI